MLSPRRLGMRQVTSTLCSEHTSYFMFVRLLRLFACFEPPFAITPFERNRGRHNTHPKVHYQVPLLQEQSIAPVSPSASQTSYARLVLRDRARVLHEYTSRMHQCQHLWARGFGARAARGGICLLRFLSLRSYGDSEQRRRDALTHPQARASAAVHLFCSSYRVQ